ncbi:hypothetical protein L873DRAFT_1291327 [Choiromyces venosus 120613-1]|uniref:Uncharacterized protein n=1 Tax=Choiromyces venosus 120613-1 TaxID=1336337 RepID=A0A3N4JC30_9PEZI|nr:hypothetical protein L873DRAFT_1291327 [Choiromyces venosus 120613-1]
MIEPRQSLGLANPVRPKDDVLKPPASAVRREYHWVVEFLRPRIAPETKPTRQCSLHLGSDTYHILSCLFLLSLPFLQYGNVALLSLSPGPFPIISPRNAQPLYTAHNIFTPAMPYHLPLVFVLPRYSRQAILRLLQTCLQRKPRFMPLQYIKFYLHLHKTLINLSQAHWG